MTYRTNQSQRLLDVIRQRQYQAFLDELRIATNCVRAAKSA